MKTNVYVLLLLRKKKQLLLQLAINFNRYFIEVLGIYNAAQFHQYITSSTILFVFGKVLLNLQLGVDYKINGFL